MAIPYWNTSAGSLGTYPTNQWMYIQLSAGSTSSSSLIYYFLNGSLPPGISLDENTGIISGVPTSTVQQTTYNFTIRLVDNFNGIKDRSFSITTVDFLGISLLTEQGTIIDTYDSQYVEYQMSYSNPLQPDPLYWSIASGSLPPGLNLSDTGVIFGWPEPPTALTTTEPTTTLYTFVLAITNNTYRCSAVYSIKVRNWLLVNPANTRVPAILNNAPTQFPVPLTDIYSPYYLTSFALPDAYAGEKYTFKIIGHDFDNNDIVYQFENMPPGLVGNAETGWITGVPYVALGTLSIFYFNVSVAKVRNTDIVSQTLRYSLLVNNGVVRDIAWSTPSNLGSLNNGDTCELEVVATSVNTLEYIVSDGKLPPNITLTTSGKLIGRIPFQPTSTLLNVGDSTTFTFTITAFNPNAPLDALNQTFTLTVNQTYDTPYETVYLRAYPDIPSKKILNSLLTNTSLIPNEYLYRPEDVNFGKAYDVRVAHMFGVYSSTYDQYISAMTINHFNKRIVLGPLQTAQANDSNGNILYEVVYCPVYDDQTTLSGASVPQNIDWRVPINLNDNYWITSGSYDNTSETAPVTSGPTVINVVYPNSLVNMRTQVASVLGQYTDQSLLPKWMTSQQANGDTLGYMPVWVLCYTKPGYSATVAKNITDNWGYTFNDIDFTVDRYYIDKTATYNWNSILQKPTWISLPSAYPQPKILGAYDFTVIFPQETILSSVQNINS